MANADQPTEDKTSADALARLARMRGLDIAPEALAALAKQLQRIESLEASELQDHAPILTMDADWHD